MRRSLGPFRRVDGGARGRGHPPLVQPRWRSHPCGALRRPDRDREPRSLPRIVDLGNPLDAPRFARNPRIARVCADLAFGQARRAHPPDLRGDAALRFSEPVYRQTAASVRLLLSGEPVQQALDQQLTPEARTVSVALRDAQRLSTGEVARLLGRSRPYAIGVLSTLRDARLVRWVGKSPKDPRAYWELDRG